MKPRFFPWRIFAKIFFGFFLAQIVTFFVAVAVAIEFSSFHLTWSEHFAFVLGFFIFALLGSLILAFRLAWPLRRVIIKALRMASKKNVVGVEAPEEGVYDDEPGEYFELEQALDKIRRKLKKRKVQLAHEREESHALMRSLSDAVVSLDMTERLKEFNSNFATQFLSSEAIAKHAAGEEIRFIDFFREPEVVSVLRRALETGSPQDVHCKLPTRLDHTGRFFSLSISPLRDQNEGEIYGALVIFHDISDLKRTEQMRAEFVENASHELRTPLTSIKGYLATALEDSERRNFDQVPAFLQIMKKNVDRLIELVNDLLTLSVLEGHPTLSWSEVVPEFLTEEVLERLGSLASQKKIMIRALYETEPFKADVKMVDHVLSNLVGNAIKYIPEGSQIVIRWTASNESICLSVKDNGPGIPEEHQARLFERFYRIDKGRSREAGGTGLGLAIVKHIMQSHGGAVSVQSRPGEGSEFVCRFPSR